MQQHQKLKRVLFLAQYLDRGGVSSHMMTLAHGLKEKGWEVAIASRGHQDWDELSTKNTLSEEITYHTVGFPSKYLSISSITGVIESHLNLTKYVKRFKPNLLHVHWRSTSLFAQLQSSINKIPFVSTLHRLNMPVNNFSSLISFWGKHVVAVSTEGRKDLIERFKILPGDVTIIYNAADETRFYVPSAKERLDARLSFGLPPKAKVISIIGSLYAKKRHDLLLKACAGLSPNLVDVFILVAGEGIMKNEIKKLALQFNLTNKIRFLGYTDSRSVLWASDCTVLPSEIEAFPMSVVEGMLCGVVPIRTPSGGAIDQISDGFDGFVVPHDDPQSITAKLNLLLSDDVLRKQMSDNAANKARQMFNIETMVSKVENVYQKILNRNSS